MTDTYAENMHDYELLGVPVEPLPPLRSEQTFRWYHLGALAACAFMWGVVVWNVVTG